MKASHGRFIWFIFIKMNWMHPIWCNKTWIDGSIFSLKIIQSKMVFSIDLKIIKIDLDHLSKLEIIKTALFAPRGPIMFFKRNPGNPQYKNIIDFLEFWRENVSRSTRWNYIFEKLETWVILVIIRDLQNHRYHI